MPMQENAMMQGNKNRYGTLSRLTHRPISGRFRTRSIEFPIHMLATNPQKRSGFCVITWGPGAIPWMVSAPRMSAITALAGMPSVSVGMNLHWASALFADSGPATPSMAPLPKRDGSFASFFSTMYEENEAMAGPVPGNTPKNAPIPVPLKMGPKDCLKSFQVGKRPVTFL